MSKSKSSYGIIVYKENKPYVKRQLKKGQIEYLDLTKWSFVDKFFGFLIASKFLEWCASSYPTPRVKEDIPAWFLIASAIQMKLHTTAAFNRIPGILRSGSILTRVKFNVGKKEGGFNNKNKKERSGSPIHQGTSRKYYKDTEAKKMEEWVNKDVAKWLRRHRGFDKRGIFLMDHTYLPLPDNENYEKADRMPLDEHGNLINLDRLSEEERKKVKYRYCYGLTTLLHVSKSGEDNVYIYAGSHLGGGSESGLTEGEKIVDNFVDAIGKRVIKLLICDRGFIDGPMITKFKKDHKIDTLIPVKSNMDILKDVIGLTKLKEEKDWELYSEEKDESGEIIKKEEVIDFPKVESWGNCGVPLYVALMRTTEKGKKPEYWAVVSTKEFDSPEEAFDTYGLRPKIEERHKQLKECWNLYKFTSTSFSLCAAHVYFTLMVYTLIQMYLMRNDLQNLTNKTIKTLQMEEKLGQDAVIVYADGKFGTFNIDEYTEIIVYLKPEANERLKKWLKIFKKQKARDPSP